MTQRTSATRIRVAGVNAVTSEGEKPANLPLVARIPLACQLYHAYAQSNFNLSLMAWYVLMLFTKTPYERGEELYNNMKDKRIVTTWIDGQPYYSLDRGQPTPGMLRVAYIPENQSPYADPHLVEDFPLEEDGSFNMRQVTKKWHLQNAYAINVSKGKSYEPKGDMPWKLSPLAIYCLTEAMGLDTLRVVERPEPSLVKARNARLNIVCEWRYLRWKFQAFLRHVLYSLIRGGSALVGTNFSFLVLLLGIFFCASVFCCGFLGPEESY